MPYNVERIFYIFNDGDTSKVKTWMNMFENQGSIHLPETLIAAIKEVIISKFYNYLISNFTSVASN